MKGKLILIVGPSGSGKGTLMAHVRQVFPELVFPTTWTTRKPRPGEENGTAQSGKAYRFVSSDAFDGHRAEDGFIEWAQFGSSQYGTPKSEVLEPLAEGKIVLQELEIQGVEQLRTKIPKDQLAVIFIDAGSWNELKRRILGRGEMSEEELEKRHVRFEEEQIFKSTADYVIENPVGKIEEAKQALEGIIRSLING